MILEYKQQYEVTETQYNLLMKVLSGIIAGRFDGQKYYIKVMCYIDYAQKVINQLIK